MPRPRDHETLTVAELIGLLKDESPDMPVYIGQPQHDRLRRVAAVEITGVDVRDLKFSSYHNCLVVADVDDDADVEGLVLS